MTKKYIGGAKVSQNFTEFKKIVPTIDIPILVDFVTDTVPIQRTNTYVQRFHIDSEILRDPYSFQMVIEQMQQYINELLRHFLEENQDKILLETIHFNCEYDQSWGGIQLSVPSMRAISVEHGNYMDQIRSWRNLRSNSIVFPRLISNINQNV
jgi:hypothetical protein